MKKLKIKHENLSLGIILILIIICISLITFSILKPNPKISINPSYIRSEIIESKRALIEAQYPEFKDFEKQDSFAGKSVISEMVDNVFYFAYAVNGSGVKFIYATCFSIDEQNNIKKITKLADDYSRIRAELSPQTCSNKERSVPQSESKSTFYINPQSVLIKDNIVVDGKKVNYYPPNGFEITWAVVNHTKDKIALVIEHLTSINDSELILMNVDGSHIDMIVKEGDAKLIGPWSIDNPIFSNDDQILYFGTGGKVAQVIETYDLKSNTIKFLSYGFLITVAPSTIKVPELKQYENFLIVSQHGRFLLGDPYDFIYLVDPLTGKQDQEKGILFEDDYINRSNNMNVLNKFFETGLLF